MEYIPYNTGQIIQLAYIVDMNHDIGLSELIPQMTPGEGLLESIFQFTTDGVLIMDSVDGNIVSANPRMIEMLGCEHHELESMHLRDIFQENSDSIETFFGSADHGNKQLVSEGLLKACNKQHLNVEFTASIVVNAGKKNFLALVKDISENKMLEANLRQAHDDIATLSLEDELTKLNNRRGLYSLGTQQLKVARRLNTDVTVFFGDLDNLKYINDNFGHAAGDKAIVLVADVLRNCFRETDIIARIGGDEFVIISFGCNMDSTKILVDRIQNELNEIAEAAELEYPLTISFGAACQNMDDTFDLEQLIKLADDRMYQIKNQHKNDRVA